MITPEYLSRFKEELMKTYKFMVKLCEENGLRYFAYGGTCIGAIRHNDIIPWDDDIDILMPRDDYYKFLDLKATIADSGFDIISYRDRGYYFPFTKVVNKHTTIWENEQNPYIIGAFVDVFPLYRVDDSIEEIRKTSREFTRRICNSIRANQDYPISRIFNRIKNHDYHGAVSFLRSRLLFSDSTKYIEDFEEFEKTINRATGSKMVSFTSSRYGLEKEIFDAEWFSDYLNVPFGGGNIRVPIGYDGMLSLVFGDYMKLPPLEKRIPDHKKYYVNLKEGLSLEECKKRIKNGEFSVY